MYHFKVYQPHASKGAASCFTTQTETCYNPEGALFHSFKETTKHEDMADSETRHVFSMSKRIIVKMTVTSTLDENPPTGLVATRALPPFGPRPEPPQPLTKCEQS